jgi:ribosomal protein L37AE/L43A
MSETGGVGARAQPFYCPYCGESDLRPGEAHGTWHCQTCTRLWALRYQGMSPPDADGLDAPPPS